MYAGARSGQLWFAVTLILVGAIFLLDLEWSRIWPVFLILGGIGALLPSLFSRPDRLAREEGSSAEGDVARS